MANGSLVPIRNSMSRRPEMRSASDRTLQEAIESIKESAEEFENLDNRLREELDVPLDRTKSLMARLLNMVIPKRFYSDLPGLVRYIGESQDVIVQIGSDKRRHVNKIQEGLRDLYQAATAKKEQLAELRVQIETAQKENWNARQLQEYVAKSVNIDIHGEISKLLDQEFGILGEEEQEARKQQLLDQLHRFVVGGERFMKLMAGAVSGGLSVFSAGVASYFEYELFEQDTIKLREAARAFVDVNKGIYAGRAAIAGTVQVSVDGIRKAIKMAELYNKYSMVSDDFLKILDEAEGLVSKDVKALTDSSPRPKALPVIDVVAAETGSEDDDDEIVEVQHAG
ncbi:MAG: hypothetical protein Q8R55_01970 [Candidatus Taylorbacteria bacterium]|nr:hypothetical protein [Candidatus Taylorbacteria bacterium]